MNTLPETAPLWQEWSHCCRWDSSWYPVKRARGENVHACTAEHSEKPEMCDFSHLIIAANGALPIQSSALCTKHKWFGFHSSRSVHHMNHMKPVVVSLPVCKQSRTSSERTRASSGFQQLSTKTKTWEIVSKFEIHEDNFFLKWWFRGCYLPQWETSCHPWAEWQCWPRPHFYFPKLERRSTAWPVNLFRLHFDH